jgi:hypothetical protein
MTMPTIDQLIDMLKKRPATVNLSDIATAAGCSESWLNQFIAGKIGKPGYDKICAIVNYLNNNKV